MMIGPSYEYPSDSSSNSKGSTSTRETLEGLQRVGFRLNTGIDGTGFILLVWTKASGYYFGAFFSMYSFVDQLQNPPTSRES
jgi:hypothetical protein